MVVSMVRHMKITLPLKEQCHEIFHVRFFHQTPSPGPNRHAQDRFQIFLNIRGVIRIRN
jgi:hypothetical protein